MELVFWDRIDFGFGFGSDVLLAFAWSKMTDSGLKGFGSEKEEMAGVFGLL